MADMIKIATQLRNKYRGGDGGVCDCGRKRKHYKDHHHFREWRCPYCRMSQKFTTDPKDTKVVKLAEAFLEQQNAGPGLFK